MTKNLSGHILSIFLVLLSCGTALALPSSGSAPHNDYRVGYGSGCSGAPCHTVTKGAFIPETLGQSQAVDWSNFCLSCHNTASEAHDEPVGTPSKNIYINQTGVIDGGRGTSHNWKGAIGNAGTRVPVSSGFSGTGYMPGGKVACQTCHNAPRKYSGEQNIDWAPGVDQGGQMRYTFGYASTVQYLAKNIKVYKSGSFLSSAPTNRRDRKQYLVDPSEYTYDYKTGAITFTASQGSDYIYAEITEPYFRVKNNANIICLDCHGDRSDQQVSHEPGTGEKDNHPVVVDYGHASGRQDTLKPSATGNVFIEGNKVLCTSCHGVHNTASADGRLLREADGTTLCAGCHKTKLDGYSSAGSVNVHNGAKHSAPTECLDCHGAHNSRNIMLVRDRINGVAVTFRSFSGADSFGRDTGAGICEVCHSATNFHRSNGGGAGHNTSNNCLKCHRHEKGFSVAGCEVCHGYPPGPSKAGPPGWADADGNLHPDHMTYLNTAAFGFLTGKTACDQCHGNGSGTRADHDTNKDSAGISTASWESWSAVGGNWGGAGFSLQATNGKVNTGDDTCTNVSCHSTSGTRTWGATACDSCHSYPGTANEWGSGNGHMVRLNRNLTHLLPSGYNMDTDTYAMMVADPARCGRCHPNVTANHRNGVVNVLGNGFNICGFGNFSVVVATTRSDVTCKNVKCHGGKRTPNWW